MSLVWVVCAALAVSRRSLPVGSSGGQGGDSPLMIQTPRGRAPTNSFSGDTPGGSAPSPTAASAAGPRVRGASGASPANFDEFRRRADSSTLSRSARSTRFAAARAAAAAAGKPSPPDDGEE